jgi:integrase
LATKLGTSVSGLLDRLALSLILLTLIRKSELVEATWNEVAFESGIWSIPKSRMNAGKPHNVYLSTQSMDIMVALHTRARVASVTSCLCAMTPIAACPKPPSTP